MVGCGFLVWAQVLGLRVVVVVVAVAPGAGVLGGVGGCGFRLAPSAHLSSGAGGAGPGSRRRPPGWVGRGAGGGFCARVAGAPPERGRRGFGTPFSKTLDLAQLIHQAISRRHPHTRLSDVRSGPSGHRAATGACPSGLRLARRPLSCCPAWASAPGQRSRHRRHAPPARHSATCRAPAPPAPLLNCAEGARREPHPTESPSTAAPHQQQPPPARHSAMCRAPAPPVPLLKCAEGARRNPHPTEQNKLNPPHPREPPHHSQPANSSNSSARRRSPAAACRRPASTAR